MTRAWRSRLRARALGRLPFEQVAAADEAAIDHAHDGVHREPGLMRQEGDHHHGADQFVGGALPAADGALDVPREPVEQRRERRESTIARPTTRLQTPGAAEISQPNSSSNSDATGTRLRRRLSRIRHRLTSVSGFGSVRAAWRRHARKDPRRDLPVAANPAMLALAVARRSRAAGSRTVRYRWPAPRPRARLRSDRG